jgi:transcriptional regulator with XRE-family HTH domain
MSLSEKLRKLRDDRNWSQQTIADLTKIGRSTISRYETGKSVPNYETLLRFAEVYRVDKEYLIEELDPSLPKTEKEPGYKIEENIADPDFNILQELFQQVPNLKKALLDLHLMPPRRRDFIAELIIYEIKAGKNSKHSF